MSSDRGRAEGLAPPMSASERKIVQEFGGWTAFCMAYGCRPWEKDSSEEAHAIVSALARDKRNDRPNGHVYGTSP